MRGLNNVFFNGRTSRNIYVLFSITYSKVFEINYVVIQVYDAIKVYSHYNNNINNNKENIDVCFHVHNNQQSYRNIFFLSYILVYG